jgi:hypothetical protein
VQLPNHVVGLPASVLDRIVANHIGDCEVAHAARLVESASGRGGSAGGSAGLLADASVDPLAQQVGVSVVAGVLLDHVDQ